MKVGSCSNTENGRSDTEASCSTVSSVTLYGFVQLGHF